MKGGGTGRQTSNTDQKTTLTREKKWILNIIIIVGFVAVIVVITVIAVVIMLSAVTVAGTFRLS